MTQTVIDNRGIAGCCARAMSGHATAVLSKILMNSRRRMGFTPRAENHLRESLIRLSRERYAALHRSKSREPMSALGHKRTFRSLRPMSALPPKADID
jgi:hypothetical protein